MEEHILPERRETEENIVEYSRKSEVRETLNDSIPDRFKRYCSVELFAEYPELLSRETLILKDQYVCAVDFPGFSSVMSEYPSEGTEFFNDVRLAVGKMLSNEEEDGSETSEYNGIYPLKNAGDEITVTASDSEVDLEGIVQFSFACQLAFMEVMEKEEYTDIRVYIEKVKDISPPYIHVGIAHGPLALRIADFGDEEEINKTDLLVMGDKTLIAKEMAKGVFAAVTTSAFDTSEMHIVGSNVTYKDRHKELKPEDTPEISLEPDVKITTSLLNKLKDNGVSWNTPTTDFPHHGVEILGEDHDEAKEYLQKTLEVIREYRRENAKSIESTRDRRIDLADFKNTARTMTNHYVRTWDMSRPPHAKEGENTGIGEGCFYGVEGLIKLRTLVKNNPEIRLDHNTTMDDLATLIVSESSVYVASEMAKILTSNGWDIEHTEFDAEDSMKLITENNIFQLNTVYRGRMSENPEIVSAVKDALKVTQGEDFNKKLIAHLNGKLSGKFSPLRLLEIMDEVDLTARAGLSSCEDEKDGITWVISEGNWIKEGSDSSVNTFGNPPTGSMMSAAARFWSTIAHGRALSRLDELENTDQELSEIETEELENLRLNSEELSTLAQENCLIMQTSVAEKIGETEGGVPIIVKLKGIGRMRLTIFRV